LLQETTYPKSSQYFIVIHVEHLVSTLSTD